VCRNDAKDFLSTCNNLVVHTSLYFACEFKVWACLWVWCSTRANTSNVCPPRPSPKHALQSLKTGVATSHPEARRSFASLLSALVCTCVYIYTHKYMYVYIYILYATCCSQPVSGDIRLLAKSSVGVRKDVDRGTFAWPQAVPSPSIDELLDEPSAADATRKLKGTEVSCENNLMVNLWKIRRKGIDPSAQTCIIDIDSSSNRSGYMVGVSPCLTRSRYSRLHVRRAMQGYN
jgi:hypothetical protein